MNQEKAIPLCLPNNARWDERTGHYSKLKDVPRESLNVIASTQQQLRAIKGDICVVGIAGPCRRGKSFILSKVFGYEGVFSLGHSMDPETMGVWMWIVPEKYKDNRGREVTVVLLDSEGIDSVVECSANDHRVFTLTVLLSSVLIYNSAGVPTRHDLEGLDFIINLSKRIHVSATGTGASSGLEQFRKTFPLFIWLLRDVLLALPAGYATLKDYLLDKVFNSNIDNNNKAHEAADSILRMFSDFDAFQLPPPSFDPEVVERLEDPSQRGKVNPKFLRGIEEFAKVLHSKVRPKMSFNDGEYVTGEALATLVEEYVTTLNTPGAVPNVQTAWQTFITNKCSRALAQAKGLYQEGMAEVTEMFPCGVGVIRERHYQVEEICLQIFHSETEGISVASKEEYQQLLNGEINTILQEMLKKNEQTTQQVCEELLVQLKAQIWEPVLMRLSGPEGGKMSYTEIMEKYSELEAAYRKRARGAEDICAAVMARFQPQLQAEMQKYQQLLKNLKDYDAKIAEEKLARANEEASKKRLEEQTKWLKEEQQHKEKELEILRQQNVEEQQRLKEFFAVQMESQKAQFDNLMKANMDQMKDERDAMMKHNEHNSALVEMFGNLVISRDQQIAELNQSVLDLAKNPPVVNNEAGGIFQMVGRMLDKVLPF